MKITTPQASSTIVPNLPIYQQIARIIQGRVYHGVYRPGQAIPSEHELSAEFGVSRVTLRQAIRELVDRRILFTRRGYGTYVVEDPRALPPINFIGYLDDLILQASTMDMTVTRTDRIPCPAFVAERLQLASDEQILVLERLGHNRDQPVNYAIHYLPTDVAREIPDDELTRGSLIEVVGEHGFIPTNAFQTLSATAVSSPIAESLGLVVGSPVIQAEFLVFSESRPIYLSYAYYRPDRTVFTASLVAIQNSRSVSRR